MSSNEKLNKPLFFVVLGIFVLAIIVTVSGVSNDGVVAVFESYPIIGAVMKILNYKSLTSVLAEFGFLGVVYELVQLANMLLIFDWLAEKIDHKLIFPSSRNILDRLFAFPIEVVIGLCNRFSVIVMMSLLENLLEAMIGSEMGSKLLSVAVIFAVGVFLNALRGDLTSAWKCWAIELVCTVVVSCGTAAAFHGIRVGDDPSVWISSIVASAVVAHLLGLIKKLFRD